MLGTGELQINNYHYESCGPFLIGKTLYLWSSRTGHIALSKVVEWEVALNGAECLKHSLGFGLRSKWKLAFKEQNFVPFPH